MEYPTNLPMPATPRLRPATLSTEMESPPMTVSDISIMDGKAVGQLYATANKRLFLFDYDGTLTGIVNDPGKALPSDRLMVALERLVADPKNHVWVVSGRDMTFLERIFGTVKQLGLSAEHGCFVRDPSIEQWVNLTEEKEMGWKPVVHQIFDKCIAATPGSWVEKKNVAIAWHYRNADAKVGDSKALECEKELNQALEEWEDAGVVMGKKVVEVRPRSLGKGAIAGALRERYTKDPKDCLNFVLCLGDDATDEDMFKVVNKWGEYALTCKIGPGEESYAKYRIGQPSDVEDMLVELAQQNSN